MNLYIIVLGTCPSKTQRTPPLCVVRASPAIPITEGWYLFYLRVCVHCKKIYCGQLDYPATGSSKCPDILSSFGVCTCGFFWSSRLAPSFASFCNSLLLSKALQLSQPLQTSTTFSCSPRESVSASEAQGLAKSYELKRSTMFQFLPLAF
jgi:hypothetical protein